MKFKKHILLILSLLASMSLFSENQNFKSDSIEERKVYREAITSFRNAEYLNAIKFFQKSLSYNIKLYGKKSVKTGNSYNALGITYRNIGNYDSSLKYFELAEEAYLAKVDQNEIPIARLYSNIGNVYLSSLNFGIAIDFYQRAASLFQENQHNNQQDIHGKTRPVYGC